MRQTDQPWVPTGIGKKVDMPTAPKDPWVKVKPGVWRNTETGKTETRIPGNEAANQQPVEEPLVPDTGSALEYYRTRGLICSE
jgi:hypothetical protein